MPFERQHPPVTWVTIAIGVFVGTAALHLTEAAAARLYLQYQIDMAASELQKAADNAKEQLEATHKAQERAANIQKEAAEERQQELAAQQRQNALQHQAEIDAKTKKDETWAKFYKRPKECDDNPDTATFTRCANEYVKAQRAFNEKYKP